MSYARTPEAMKSRLRDKIIASRAPGISEKEIAAHLAGAITHSVCAGGVLPDVPSTEAIEFSETHSVFSNAGGLILQRPDGIKISVEAADAGRFVAVRWNGEVVAMTKEQAFDRALREDENWHMPCSLQEATRAIVGNVVAAAKHHGAFDRR